MEIYRTFRQDFPNGMNDIITVPIEADGNCQFSALGFHLDESSDQVRYTVCQELELFSDEYKCFIDCPFNEYIVRLRNNKEWGDNITLQAAAKAYNISIIVFIKLDGKVFISRINDISTTVQEIYLLFENNHYDTIEIRKTEMVSEIVSSD